MTLSTTGASIKTASESLFQSSQIRSAQSASEKFGILQGSALKFAKSQIHQELDSISR